MKVLKHTLAVAAAVAMIGAPVAASAAGTASRPLVSSVARAGTPVGRDASKLRGSRVIVALLAAAAIIGGILAASSGNSKPRSP